MEDDDNPRPAKRWIEPKILDPLSVEDLQDYITALTAEITRAQSTIAAKQSHRSAAEAFFRR